MRAVAGDRSGNAGPLNTPGCKRVVAHDSGFSSYDEGSAAATGLVTETVRLDPIVQERDARIKLGPIVRLVEGKGEPVYSHCAGVPRSAVRAEFSGIG